MRNAQAEPHLIAFVVAGVSTVLVTRAFLALTGYPRIGGRSLHIAHVLPGGLLMLVALFLLLSYVGPAIRTTAAVLGGIGFGLFIDEVGKFVTSDNDYFYAPAAAIMYVVFAAVVLAAHALHRRHPLDPREHLANAVDQAVEGVAGGLSDHRRRTAREQLGVAHGEPAAPAASALLAACPADEVALPPLLEHARRTLRRGFDRLAGTTWVRRTVVVVLVLHLLAAVGITAAAKFGDQEQEGWLPFVGVLCGTVVSAVFVGLGMRQLRRDRREALRAFQFSVLVSLLLTRVFQFAEARFTAVGSLLFDLLLLGVLGAEAERLRREQERTEPHPAELARAAGSSRVAGDG
mgnify:CR=1 FL=1